jgi:hypothetical protein
MQVNPVRVVATLITAAALSLGLTACSGDAPSSSTSAPQATAAAPKTTPTPAATKTSETPTSYTDAADEQKKVHDYLVSPKRSKRIQSLIAKIGPKFARDLYNDKFGPILEDDLTGYTGWTSLVTLDQHFYAWVWVNNGTIDFSQVTSIRMRNKRKESTSEVLFVPPTTLPGGESSTGNGEEYWRLVSYHGDVEQSTDMMKVKDPTLTFAGPTNLKEVTALTEEVIAQTEADWASWK